MPRVCFIVNPVAGHGRALAEWKQIEPLAAQLGDYCVKFTQGPRHGTALAREAVQEGYDRVVSMGGDGTLNDVGNGLMGSRAALAVIPAGTGNDWVRTARLPRDPVEGCRMAFQGRVARIDVGLARGHRYFFNGAGFGFDAEVCDRIRSYGPRFRKLSYLRGVFDTLFRFTGVPVDVEIDGQRMHLSRVLLLEVGNGRYFGGGMQIFPGADFADGLFEIAWGENLGRLELLRLVSQIYSGKHVGHPKVRMMQGRKVTASSPEKVVFQLDGDVAGHLPVTFEIIPQALDVVLPTA
ncbi:diacylglycerol/lipid kinase family protein [Symbiobacterium terraclitae]|uniref:diacylglycerol/lipid kinase family protein n=1 Tax=Symbiobacterium terraclitae TaxID=557451 RepID=UPI0035B523E2